MKSMSSYKYRLLQGLCLILAIVIIYNTVSLGQTEAMSGWGVNVPLYIGALIAAVSLVGLSVYFSTKINSKR